MLDSEGAEMSILGRMLFLLCIFLLATMSIVGGFAYFNYRENCRIGELGVQRAVLGMANYAQLFLHTAESSVTQLARAPQILDAVGSLPVMTQGSPLIYMEPLPPAAAALRTLLDTTLYGSPRLLQAGFLDVNGGFMASPSLRVILANDPRSRPWYTRALKMPEGTVVRSTYLSAPGNEPVCAFSQAVYDDGRPVGVAYMEVSLRAFSQSLAILKPGTSGGVYVLDEHKGLLVAPDIEHEPGTSPPLPEEVIDAPEGSHYSTVNGVESFWAVHRDGRGFCYIVIMDAAELLYDSNMLLLRSCIGAGLVLLIILVVGYAIAGSAIMPLARLESAANAIADGSPDAVLPDSSEFAGEIRGLRNAMARMLVKLRATAASAQRTAQQASVNERYALSALQDISRRYRDYRNKMDALRLAAQNLAASAAAVSEAEDDEHRKACLQDLQQASQTLLRLAARKEEDDTASDEPADAEDSPRA